MSKERNEIPAGTELRICLFDLTVSGLHQCTLPEPRTNALRMVRATLHPPFVGERRLYVRAHGETLPSRFSLSSAVNIAASTALLS